MLVPVTVVRGMPVTVVHVVDMVPVLHRVVPAVGVVLAVGVTFVHDVLTARRALVPVAVVLTVDVAVV